MISFSFLSCVLRSEEKERKARNLLWEEGEVMKKQVKEQTQEQEGMRDPYSSVKCTITRDEVKEGHYSYRILT